MAFDAVLFVQQVPSLIEELSHKDDEMYWREAMKREIEPIEKNNTWKEVNMQEGTEILTTRWVFALKPLEENPEDKYKARLVVRGFAQKNSFDYNDIHLLRG